MGGGDTSLGFIAGCMLSMFVWLVLTVASYKPTVVEGWYVLNAFMVCQADAGADYLVKNDKGWKVRCNSGLEQDLKE